VEGALSMGRSDFEHAADELAAAKAAVEWNRGERLRCAESVAQYTADWYGTGELGQDRHRHELGRRIENYRTAYAEWSASDARLEEARRAVAAMESAARRRENEAATR
jgi:hypothetical protein